MKNKKLLASVVLVSVLFVGLGSVFADGYNTPTSHSTQFQVYNAGTSSYDGYDIDTVDSHYGLFASSGYDNHPVSLTIGDGLTVDGTTIKLNGPFSVGLIDGLGTRLVNLENGATADETTIASHTSSIGTHTAQISTLNSSVGSISMGEDALYSRMNNVDSWFIATSTSHQASATNPGLMSKTDKSKIDVISGKRQETYSGTTNGSGVYTVTFPTAFSVAPNIQAGITNGTDTQTSRITSISTTGFTILVRNRTDVIGLLPSYANVSGATVDVVVTEK